MPPLPPIRYEPLPYVERLEARGRATVDLVVIHCTELPDLAAARDYGERVVYPSGTGNSGHYYVDRDGAIVRYVPVERIAHHVRGHNAHSVGIELVNRGRFPDWFDSRHQDMAEAYPAAQIEALVALLAYLRATLPQLRRIAGHEDLDAGLVQASDDAARMVRRKLDPGPRFPWPRVMAACCLERSPRSL